MAVEPSWCAVDRALLVPPASVPPGLPVGPLPASGALGQHPQLLSSCSMYFLPACCSSCPMAHPTLPWLAGGEMGSGLLAIWEQSLRLPRELGWAVRSGGATGSLCSDLQAQMPGGCQLAEGPGPPLPSWDGCQLRGPRKQAACGLHATPPHDSSRAMVLNWAVSHVCIQFWW